MVIWLASYPRSGNTFLRVILNSIFGIKTYSLHDDSLDIAADRETSEVVGHALLPSDFDLDQARQSEEIYIIKTHDVPKNNEDKAIYLIRDGRESCFSYFKYQRNFTESAPSLLDIIYGKVAFGGWGKHVKAWDPVNREGTLLIKFEDLIERPQEYISQLADLLGVSPSKGDVPTFAELQQVNPKFFMSGKKNSWKSRFSEEEHLAFWMKNYSAMVAHGYEEDMPPVFIDNRSVACLLERLSEENSYLLESMQRSISDKDEQLREKDELLQQVWAKNSSLNLQVQDKDSRIQKEQQSMLIREGQFQAQEAHLRSNFEKSIEVKEKQLQSTWKKSAEQVDLINKQLHMLESKEKRLSDLAELGKALRSLCAVSVKRSPVKKLDAYRKMLEVFNRVGHQFKLPK